MVTWDYSQKRLLGGRPTTKPRDHDTPNAHNHWFLLLYHAWGPAWTKIHRNNIRSVEGPVTHDFTLHLTVPYYTTWFRRCVRDDLWTLSFRSPQFHGHGSWLVCELEPNISLWICTHTQTTPINIDLCPPIPYQCPPKTHAHGWTWAWVWAPNVGLWCEVALTLDEGASLWISSPTKIPVKFGTLNPKP